MLNLRLPAMTEPRTTERGQAIAASLSDVALMCSSEAERRGDPPEVGGSIPRRIYRPSWGNQAEVSLWVTDRSCPGLIPQGASELTGTQRPVTSDMVTSGG